MDSRTFEKYLIDKYGSIEWAMTNYHHYEKVVTRENPAAQITMTTIFEINEKKLTNDALTIVDLEYTYNVGEMAYVGSSYESNTYSGQIISWNSANGYIVLANTSGAAKSYDFLIGANSAANGTILTTQVPSAPMDAYNTLVDTTGYSTYTVDNKTVIETISRNKVSYYDYEVQLNDSKRQIKIIQPQYYSQIMSELDNLTNTRVFFRRP